MSASTKTNYSVPNLERSFHLMEQLAQSTHGLTLTELVQLTSYPQNSIFRICRTLEELGYLERTTDTKRYHLTQRILTLGLGSVSPGRNLTTIAAPFLEQIAQETGETTCLGTIVGTQGVVLSVADGHHPFRFHIDLGTPFHLHTAAPGKAMLAVHPNPSGLLTKLPLPRFTEHTITSHKNFRSHLQQVRDLGYGTDQEEHHLGQHCIGAAIRIPGGSPPCALWITAPSSRLTIPDFPRLGNHLRQIALDIEHLLTAQS